MHRANNYKKSTVMMLSRIVLSLLVMSGSHAYAEALPEMMQQLRSGGYILYMRHAATDHQQQDHPDLKVSDCASQRNLSVQGKEYAAQVAAFLSFWKIPISTVISSPLCRSKDTATLIFGHSITKDFLYFSAGLGHEMRERYSLNLRRYLNQSVAQGSNLAVVGHTSNLLEAVGIWPEPEGVIHLFRPQLGDKPAHVGYISPDDIRLWVSSQ